jgi:hypothetical protein
MEQLEQVGHGRDGLWTHRRRRSTLVAVVVAVTVVCQPSMVQAVTPRQADPAAVGHAEPSDAIGVITPRRADAGAVGHAEPSDAIGVITPRQADAAAVGPTRDPIAAVDVTAVDAEATPDEIVSELQTLLSHHATLAIRLTRATLTGDPGFAEAADNALVRNINDLRAALAPVIGARRAGQFGSQWESQTRALFQYAAGIRDDAPDDRRRARRQLRRGIEVQKDLLARLGGDRVDTAEVAEALRTQVGHQIAQADAFGREDHDRAYELQRVAFAEAFPLGRMTASAAVRVPEPTPTDDLRTALALLLGEHVELAIDTMRTGASGADDFEAASAALDANTADLTDAMDALFGARRAQEFNEVWADHIDLFVDYTIAVVEDDAAARQEVRDRFDRVVRRFGTTLETATNGRVDADGVVQAMGEHEQQLVDQIELFADDDLGAAHGLSYRAYVHIRHVAEDLATAFAAAAHDDMPVGGSQTGGGGTASW